MSREAFSPLFFATVLLTLFGSFGAKTTWASSSEKFLCSTGSQYSMGPSDLLGTHAHTVSVGAFCIGKEEITAGEFASFLNDVGYIRQPEVSQGKYPAQKVRGGIVLLPSRASDFEQMESVYMIESRGNSVIRRDNRFEAARGKEHKPANWVTFYGAVAYCEWLSRKTGLQYRLPTEAEWEHAALTFPEMVGVTSSVWEWCSDLFGPYPESVTDAKDPTKSPMSEIPLRVLRGGPVTSKIAGSGRGSAVGATTPKSRESCQPLCGSSPVYGFRIVRQDADSAEKAGEVSPHMRAEPPAAP